MKLYNTAFIVTLSFFLLTSCLSDKGLSSDVPPDDQIVYSEEEIPELKGLIVGFSTPTIVKKGEDVILEAKIINNSNNDFRMIRRNEVYSFYISDENDKILNTFTKDDAGVINTLRSGESIKESYLYKFDKPGEYKVWAVAHFKILNSSIENQNGIQTKKEIIKVH